MRRCLPVLLGILASFVLVTVTLANNPQVDALRQQVKQLKAEQKEVVKHIHQHYESLIRQDKLDERQRGELRRELDKQEKHYLSLATTHEQREEIRHHYDHMRKVLSGKIRMDAGAIRQLREQEKVHVRHMQEVYKAQIKHLEQEIKVASKAGKGKKK
jgi:hypothetical protein